jgi:N-acetyl-anhydromuramyl-L-alanine amidase AmpD
MCFALTKGVSQTAVHIQDKKVSFGYKTATGVRGIDVVIVHSVFNNSGGDIYDADLVLKQFAQYGVSAHYLIGRDGAIYRLVSEKDIAYHAGRSALPDGRTKVNTCSLGIELITSFDEAPAVAQIKSLTWLVNDIKKRYRVKYVLRHSDIAPGRKTDPWNMDWEAFLKTLN